MRVHSLAGLKDVEYRLAQSGDATCSGLENSEYGSRIMTLKRFGPAERCDFPKWFKEPKHWHSLNGELSYNVHQKYVSCFVVILSIHWPSDASIHDEWRINGCLLKHKARRSTRDLMNLSAHHKTFHLDTETTEPSISRRRNRRSAWNLGRFASKSTSRHQTKQ